MKKRIKKKIADLHQQPEHVRYRAASIFAIGSGIVIVGLWLAVLLPLQLRFQPGSKDKSSEQEVEVAQEVNQGSPINANPQVGGIQDIVQSALPTTATTRQPQISPSAVFSPTAPPEETKPVAIEEIATSPNP